MIDTENPYKVPEGSALSVSGGRTSGYMFQHIIAAWGGVLPETVYPIFCDTGKEHTGTYKFLDEMENHFCHKIYRIKRPHDGYDTPYDALLAERKYLPNAVTRFCTEELKVKPIIKFMKERGHNFYTNVIGFRADEPARLKRKALECSKDFQSFMPMAIAKVTKPMVLEWWRGRNFDLDIPPGCGNCEGCFLKSYKTLVAIEQRVPGTLTWYNGWEKRVGATFTTEYSMDQIQDFAGRQGQLFQPEENSVDCACHD